MTEAEQVEITGDWAGEDESVRVYQLEPEPSADWWEWFEFHAGPRLAEVRPPFGVELARQSSTIEASRIRECEVGATDEMVHSLVKVTNDRMIREARRAAE